MKIDILIFGAHPDDVELGCGGTVIKLISQGKKVAIIDLTKGELGTRGTPQTRKEECKNATKILGVEIRENMDFKDGFFENDEYSRIFRGKTLGFNSEKNRARSARFLAKGFHLGE